MSASISSFLLPTALYCTVWFKGWESHQRVHKVLQGLVTFQGTLEWRNERVRALILAPVIQCTISKLEGRLKRRGFLMIFVMQCNGNCRKLPWTVENGRVLFFGLAQMCHLQQHGRQPLALQSQRSGLNLKALHVLLRSPCAKELYWDSTPPGLHYEVPLVFLADI